ncbi:MAG: protein-export chaperone SecB [Gemmatimonadaceae bacterium]
MIANDHKAGYRIEKVYVAEQSYRIVADQEKPNVDATAERKIAFGWDWRPIGAKRFEVVITVTVEPSKDFPEHVSVRLIGLFTVDDGALSIGFAEFLRVNAPAILFPYAREIISTMTGRGPFGTFHLNPINVPSLLADIDITVSTGHKVLRDDLDFAKSFGLPVELDVPAAPTT